MDAIERILVPTDFSPDSLRALDYARELALRFRAEIVLLHVDHTLARPASEVGEERERLAREELDHLVRMMRAADVRTQALFRRGVPSSEILKEAEAEGTSLIVMATHGRTGLSRVLMGSVAENVVRHSPCPVLVLRHRDGTR